MIITKFNRRFFFKPTKHLEDRNAKKNQRRHFQYDLMTDDLWKEYKRTTKVHIQHDTELANFIIPNAPDVHTINFLNNKLEECMVKSAKSKIPNKIMSKGYRNLKAKPLVTIERYLKKCNRTARSLHKAITEKEGFPDRLQWNEWITTARAITRDYELKEVNWADLVNAGNLKQCQKQVNRINKFLLNLYRSSEAITTRIQIGKYFEQRCNDLKTHQSRMIDSLLERPNRRIRLDKVMIDDETLSLDQKEIETKVTSHFQTYAGPTTGKMTIPDDWKKDYEPLPLINDNCYNDQLIHITLPELNEVLSKCPNGKAAGVSTISYEMVKHSSKEFKRKLILTYNMCIDLGITPNKWKHALLFPIPKPMEWECDINKTRPIVLIEIFRKIFVKIITQRLSKTLVEHNILKGGNHAGLPGGSTFEPIRIMNLLREDAINNKKPLYMYFQDMSKAYDRVRLDILIKAMERLKIPDKLIQLIISLFTDRTNSVITEFGTTSPYKVLIGIDQGEVISPLLWTIYYDPLLSRINSKNFGYEMNVRQIKDIHNSANRITIKEQYTVSAFLDDTELYAPSPTNLGSELSIMNSFYRFTNIKVNADKAILITNETKYIDTEGYIKVIVEGKITKIKVTPVDEQIRFLGVYFNINGKNSQLIAHLNSITNNAAGILSRKRSTPDHIVYIYNRVIVPRLEYLMQINVLTKNSCNQLSAPFRRLIKHKARLSSTTSNSVIHGAHPYGLIDLFRHQLAVHADWLNIQFNNMSKLGHVTFIRLLQLQYKY